MTIEAALSAREGALPSSAIDRWLSCAPEEVASRRMQLSPGYRFDATQALRQVLAGRVVG